MIPKKRYHPLTIIFDVWGYIKGSFIIALFLFVFNYDSDSFIWKYGRYAFVIITIIVFLSFVWKWLTYRYEMTDSALHLYTSYIAKKERVIPFNKVQNIHRKTSVLHRLFHMTSLQLETAMTEENATITFQALSQQEASKMESIITSTADNYTESNEADDMDKSIDKSEARTVHFTATKRDTIRAFFSTFGFIVPIFILFSLYVKIDEMFDVEEQAKDMTSTLFASWWMTLIAIIALLILSILIGIIRIYLKYGRYEISSDDNRIYIVQGLLNERSFTIPKQNVQAINIQQSLMKRLLGIVEIKLINAGNTDDDDDMDISSLYPFLKTQRAYAMLGEMLPQYKLTEEMVPLTRPALWLGLFRGTPLYVIPAAALAYFQPVIWGVTGAWWMISLLIFILINLVIILNYRRSGYKINESFIQIQTGGLGTELFLSKRDKIIEVKVTQSPLQKKFGVASFEISNRSHPVEETDITDIPFEAAGDFYQWYRNRTSDIQVEQ